MRVLLRLLAPLLGLAVAAAGLLLGIEVVAAWVHPPAATGLIVPWPQWRRTLETTTWSDFPVPQIAIAVAAVGLALLLVGLLARRSDIMLAPPAPEITVSTSPRVLARLVGRRVRAGEDVKSAGVTATKRRVAVTAQGWTDPDPQLRSSVQARVDELLDELPLQRRPRIRVNVPQVRESP
jgi:hypothetical protein